MNNKGLTVFNTILSVVLLGAIIYLFSNNATNSQSAQTESPNDSISEQKDLTNKTSGETGSFGSLKVVYINTDSLWEQYEYVQIVLKKLEREQTRLQASYEAKMLKIQRDYNDYMEKGKANLLTLQQQKEREASLTKQQDDIKRLEEEVTKNLYIKKQELNNQINDTILAFINRYRVANGYDLILQYAYLNGILSATPEIDVTEDVVAKLNQEYQAFKK